MRNLHNTLSFDFIGDSLGTCGALVINPINDLAGRLVKSFLCLVKSPFRIFTFSERLPKVIHFLLEQLRPAAHCFGPMGRVLMTLNLVRGHGGYPTVGTGLYVWVSYIQ